ncbi:aspartate aminotransferase, cytoplasmic-like isoform X2 [Dysidea avara]
MSSVFGHVQAVPNDAIFNLKTLYESDTHPQKVDLGIGAYRTEDGTPWVLPVVRTVEAQMSSDETLNHEYLAIDGLRSFTDAAARLLLGEDSVAITENRYCGVQTLSGTGALRLAFEFYLKHLGQRAVYISKPTWGNHRGVIGEVGFTDIREYCYWNAEQKAVDIDGLLRDLKDAPEGSIVLLQACAHNPTGMDPTKEQWRLIADVVQERKLIPLFDSAYQGFASGDVDNDAYSVREFVKRGVELFTAQSFSKNFGLYNERTGSLCCVLSSTEMASVVRSQLKYLCRRLWSNPPNHGARIVATVLNNPALRADWLESLLIMSSRIKKARQELYQRLRTKGTPGTWEHIVTQIGMFSFSGLSVQQCEVLTNKYHIYLLKNGRISMCGLNSNNLDYVAAAIDDVVRQSNGSVD